MNAYQKRQLNRIRRAQRSFLRIIHDLSDVYGTDEVCELCRRGRELSEAAEEHFITEHQD